jgi:hypothetical protein
MNSRGDDYVMGHLLKAARSSGASKLDVDLLSGVATPQALLAWPIAASVESYCLDFRGLVERNGSDVSFVRTAVLSVEFDISISRPYSKAPDLRESPYTCVATIEDDRGKTFRSELKGWWYPET